MKHEKGRKETGFCVDKKNQLDVTFCILYFPSNRREIKNTK